MNNILKKETRMYFSLVVGSTLVFGILLTMVNSNLAYGAESTTHSNYNGGISLLGDAKGGPGGDGGISLLGDAKGGPGGNDGISILQDIGGIDLNSDKGTISNTTLKNTTP
ncbi:MAG: hypothetical protein AB7U98_03815 [Candidatus Nitrosocosmicus sp.]